MPSVTITAFQRGAFQLNAFQIATSNGGQYRLLCPHFIQNAFLPQMTVVTDGVEVPMNWVPTMEVDPLNTAAVNQYYAAGPRSRPQSIGVDQQGWLVPPAKFTVWVKPITFWFQVGNRWFLSGLGAGLPPVIM